MELTINGKVTLDASPQLMAALSALAAAFGKNAQPEVKTVEVQAEQPLPEVKYEPKPTIITDAELRERTSAVVKTAGKESVLAVLMEIGNTNKITDLSQEQRNQFVERIKDL